MASFKDVETLRGLKEKLENTPNLPWSEVTNWVQRTDMLIRQRWPEWSSTWVDLIKEPDFPSKRPNLPTELPGRPHPDQQVAAQAKQNILNFVEGLLDLDFDEEPRTDQPAASKSQPQTSGQKSKVFIVHGHDHGAKETIARFIGQLDLDPIILHEQPNQGRTIIEKFEDHSEAMYAIVLLTPDDQGSVKGQDPLRDRARQNVLFEHGFFYAKLGRSKVCALVKGDVERPSDIGNVLYIEMDNQDGWKLKVAKELKAAGLITNLDKLT